MKYWSLILIFICEFLLHAKAASLEGLVLIENGVSPYTIHVASGAPKSVLLAAREMQRVLRLATGCTLPVTTEPSEQMLSLGDNASARAAGLKAGELAEESFQILTHGAQVFIVGHDTSDGETTRRDGISRGTLYGTYEFLERTTGVRWIMPGDLGEIISHHERLVVPPTNHIEGPSFAGRQLELSDPPVVQQWALRNRVGTQPGEAGALRVDSSHSWNELMPQTLRDAHPEWAAQNPYPEKPNYKFCTRNTDAVAVFTQSLFEKLNAMPRRWMVSISPSDGQSFCHCALCGVQIELNPHGKEASTRNLLDFYNTVARAVARSKPERMLGALVYGANEYPPAMPMILDEHLFLEWAPLDVYGLGLYKEGYSKRFDELAGRWKRMATHLGYSNYLHWHRSSGSAPLAPAPELMKLEFATLKKYGFESVREAVDPNWAYAGPNNWLLARLMWKADADVDALYQEWLSLAYGSSAEPMRRIYTLLDDAFRKYKQLDEPFHYSVGQYEIDKPKILKIYLPLLPAIDLLCRDALAKATDEAAQKRVELFVDNLKFFHQALLHAGYPLPAHDLIFGLDSGAFAKFSNSPEPSGTPPARYFMRHAKPLPPLN